MVFKRAINKLCEQGPLSRDYERRNQLEESAGRPAGHIAEGYGRFSPPDFARFTVIARSSLMEAQNHLIDAVDRRYITEDERVEFNKLAEDALEQVTGLMEYLQSPEALRNARRARERRIASRDARKAKRTPNKNREGEPGTEPEPERRREKPEE